MASLPQTAAETTAVEPLDVLTKREREVFWLVADRLRNREIAEQLFVAERTVESHVASLLRKLGGNDRTDLIAMAERVRGPAGGVRVPRILASFVGRHSEVAALRDAIAAHRLVTVTGPAGVGKTRVPFRVAELVTELPPPFLIDLAAAPDGQSVEQVFAAALGLLDSGASLLTAIVDALGDGRRWLLVDNAEHVADEARNLVEELLTNNADLHVLVTSRTPLRVPGEYLVEMAPLEVPNLSDEPAQVLGAPSARLFADRAATAAPGFVVTPQNACDIATLCRRLDGLPLAIELAAARIRTFKVDELVGHLDARFELLTEGTAAGQGRHATLEDALRWSHELLDDDERVLFERLAVFPAEFDYDTARDIVAHDPLDHRAFLRLFPRVLDRSLLSSRRLANRPTTYRMLESFRAFARDRLSERDELATSVRRHADHHLERATSLVPDLEGRDQPTALAWFRAHEIDLSVAMHTVLDGEDVAAAWSLVAGVGTAWPIVGIRSDLFGWLETLLEHPWPDGIEGVHARLATAWLLVYRDAGQAAAMAQQAHDLAVEADEEARARADLTLGWTLGYLGDKQESVTHLSRAHASFEHAGDDWRAAAAVRGLGRAHRDIDTSIDHFTQATAMFRRAGDMVTATNCLTSMATRCLETNAHLPSVPAWLDEARELAQATDNGHELLHVDLHRARLHQLEGRHEPAAAAFERVMPELRRIGDRRCARRCLIGLGWAAMSRGDHPGAHSLLTAGVELATEVHDPRETAAGMRLLAALAQVTGDTAGAEQHERASDEVAALLDVGRRNALPRVADILRTL